MQVSATRHQGSLVVDPGRAGRGPASSVEGCRWCYATTPVYGWGGDAGRKQLSTAGWLAALPVFEPHWQILMSKWLSTALADPHVQGAQHRLVRPRLTTRSALWATSTTLALHLAMADATCNPPPVVFVCVKGAPEARTIGPRKATRNSTYAPRPTPAPAS